MRPGNPACYECPKGEKKLHTWKRLTNREAVCIKCGTVICERDADEVFTDYEIGSNQTRRRLNSGFTRLSIARAWLRSKSPHELTKTTTCVFIGTVT